MLTCIRHRRPETWESVEKYWTSILGAILRLK
jgi:hypothetical protein